MKIAALWMVECSIQLSVEVWMNSSKSLSESPQAKAIRWKKTLTEIPPHKLNFRFRLSAMSRHRNKQKKLFHLNLID